MAQRSVALSVLLVALLAAWQHWTMRDLTTQPAVHALASGFAMPALGLGTAGLHGKRACDAWQAAHRLGYTLVDTAAQRAVWYRNEIALGECWRTMDVRRETLFLTTKLFPADHGSNNSVRALQTALRNLQTDYVDLFIFHYAQCWGDVCDVAGVEGSWQDSWRALRPFVKSGVIRSLGVSNFWLPQLRELVSLNDVPLSVIQDWMDPLHQAKEKRAFCRQHNIRFQAYSSLGAQHWKQKTNPVLTSPVLLNIAQQHNVSSAQVVLRWLAQSNVSVVVKSSNEAHLRENRDAYLTKEWSLTNIQMQQIEQLDAE